MVRPMKPVLAPTIVAMFEMQPKPNRAETIAIVNGIVNRAISQQTADIGLVQPIKLGPAEGRCADYAATKQWILAAFGIESELCECWVGAEAHMVTLVDGMVLDSLTDVIGPMRYRVKETAEAGKPLNWDSPDRDPV
jgi:predicted transglutaminase-like cysteine proteinase